MPVPALEPFTGDGALSGNWTQQFHSGSADVTRVADQGAASANNEAQAYWTGDAFANDQYSQFVVKVIDPALTKYFGPSVRASGADATRSAYFALMNNSATNAVEIWKLVVNAYTLLQTITATVAVNDVLRIEVQGSTIIVKRNGAQIGTNQTDTDLTSGSPGLMILNTVSRVDDWEGGNLGVVAGGWSVYRPYTLGSAIAALTTGGLFYYWRRRKQEKPDE